jgi:hypothetical protein
VHCTGRLHISTGEAERDIEDEESNGGAAEDDEYKELEILDESSSEDEPPIETTKKRQVGVHDAIKALRIREGAASRTHKYR